LLRKRLLLCCEHYTPFHPFAVEKEITLKQNLNGVMMKNKKAIAKLIYDGLKKEILNWPYL